MKVELQHLGKRYRHEWVLRNVTWNVQAPGRYAVTGPNGSGKSTLLRLLSGQLSPSKGRINFSRQNQPIESALIYRHLSYAAPYIELIEEFTLQEAIAFHRRFKPLYQDMTPEQLIELLGFQKSAHKPIRFFSSGMKQRLRLALAICAQSELLLLDEPSTNLDAQGINWYRQLVEDFGANRLIIVASNAEVDYAFCTEHVDVMAFKSTAV